MRRNDAKLNEELRMKYKNKIKKTMQILPNFFSDKSSDSYAKIIPGIYYS
ncbi:MAG: hypothetical protein GF383_07425 [Candidatus Lokiarchaeota archaeon]|nr:hypothetical protein [Candidatus Lokiarchaeota archaeon]